MPRKNYRRQKGLNKTEKKEVTSMMHATRETKVASFNSGQVLHNSAVSQADLIPICPPVTQGPEEGMRSGNEIRSQKLQVQGLVNGIYNGARSRAKFGVRVMIFSVKGYKDGPGAITNAPSWIGALLRNGTNVQTFDGSVRSYFLPLNTDLVTVHSDKRINLTYPFQLNTGIAPDSTSFPVQTQFSYKYWKAVVKCKNKKILFSSQTSTGGVDVVPNNFGPIMAIGYCKLDGSAPDVLDTGLSSEISSQLYFEDA